MQFSIIPCVEDDDELIADKLNAITDSKIDFEDAIEDELVVFKVTDSDGNIIAGCNLIINCWRVADLDILWVEEKCRRQGIRLTPLNACFMKVELRINKIRHYYFPSSVMGGQFNDLIDALYVLYNEGGDGHSIHGMKKEVDWKETENGNEATHISSQFTWNEEGTLVKVSLRRVINDSSLKANPKTYDPIMIKVSGGRYDDDFECTVDGQDLCYAAAKGYTEALKRYGFYGYFSSTCDNFSVNASVLMERFLFIKAYALNALETRALSKAWDNPHSWRKIYRTDFEKEIELLLFDM